MARTKEVIVLYTDDGIGNSIGEIVGEVVRCKDCMECEERHTANYLPFLYCRLNEHSVLHNAFCWLGERREDAET